MRLIFGAGTADVPRSLVWWVEARNNETYIGAREVGSKVAPEVGWKVSLHPTRFKRALEVGDLAIIRAAAAELPYIGLEDALRICVVASRSDFGIFERAAVRWLGRFCLERPDVSIDTVRVAANDAGAAASTSRFGACAAVALSMTGRNGSPVPL
jgi:hypothetical protein